MNSHQRRAGSPRKHISLSKRWFNTRRMTFSKYAVIKYNNNNRQHIHYLCSVFCRHILLSPGLTLPRLISFQLSIPEGIQATLETQQSNSLLGLNWKCISFVCPNVVDKLVFLASSPHLFYPSQQYLSVIGWRVAYWIWCTPTNEDCAYSRIGLINGRSVCVNAGVKPRVLSGNVFFL